MQIEIANDILIPEIQNLVNEDKSVTLRVKGISMRPFLEHLRDKVVIEKIRRSPKAGDVVLAEVAQKYYVLHRIIRKEGIHLTLQGDGNPRTMTEECTENDIVGIVSGFLRKGSEKILPVSSLRWRIYSRLWLLCRPMRRYLLAFHRKIWLKIFPVKLNSNE